MKATHWRRLLLFKVLNRLILALRVIIDKVLIIVLHSSTSDILEKAERYVGEDSLIVSVINRFLYAHSLKNRNIFIRRYWYLCSIQDIADSYKMSESNVKVLLFRMRNELKKQLEKEGVHL